MCFDVFPKFWVIYFWYWTDKTMRSHKKWTESDEVLIPMHFLCRLVFFVCVASLNWETERDGEPSPTLLISRRTRRQAQPNDSESERTLEKQCGQLQNLPISTTPDHLNLTHWEHIRYTHTLLTYPGSSDKDTENKETQLTLIHRTHLGSPRRNTPARWARELSVSGLFSFVLYFFISGALFWKREQPSCLCIYI